MIAKGKPYPDAKTKTLTEAALENAGCKSNDEDRKPKFYSIENGWTAERQVRKAKSLCEGINDAIEPMTATPRHKQAVRRAIDQLHRVLGHRELECNLLYDHGV